MLNVDNFLKTNYPDLKNKRPRLYKFLSLSLRFIFNERKLLQFEEKNPRLKGFDFVDQVLNYFDFSFSVRESERERVPRQGPVVIIANHPIGSLDGLAILKLVREMRADVRVVANDLLMAIEPLQSVLIPVDNINGKTTRDSLMAIDDHLKKDGALIVFPAGEVSRFGLKGVRDNRWRYGFLHFASNARAPILPICIKARNSVLFYLLSIIIRPLSTAWLVREMYKQKKNCVNIRIGNPILYDDYSKLEISKLEKTKLFKRHLYQIGKGKEGILPSKTAIATPENRATLRQAIRDCQLLGETHDNKHIYLYPGQYDSCLLREIGRLREIAFRAVGEGSGTRRDIDIYDNHYYQLILWDEDELEIAGAYRLCPSRRNTQLYSETLFEFLPDFEPILEFGIELGRSFVQPRYWGKRSLDYLWFGIGAFLRANPQYRYLFGPVTLSNTYPKYTLEMLVYFYSTHFPSTMPFVKARIPFLINESRKSELKKLYPGKNYLEEFKCLKSKLNSIGFTVPTLYKQYSELFDAGGVEFADFNVDPDFSFCVDGLIVVDLHKLKEKNKKRYITQK